MARGDPGPLATVATLMGAEQATPGPAMTDPQRAIWDAYHAQRRAFQARSDPRRDAYTVGALDALVAMRRDVLERIGKRGSGGVSVDADIGPPMSCPICRHALETPDDRDPWCENCGWDAHMEGR